jgi:CO/xanthine dehydrogenase Mo-binding subunit
MTEIYRPTRRTFLLQTAWGTVALIVTPVSASTRLAEARKEGEGAAAGGGPEGWSGPPGTARYRIDGLPKVLGEKIYARDFRARDIPGWPQQERMALVLRATYADRPFLDLDLSVLPPELRPERVVDQAQLNADSITDIYPDTSPQGRPPGYMVEKGQVPVYFGQPLALLIFRDASTYRRAYRLLQFNHAVARYGTPAEPPPLTTPYNPPTYLTRYVDAQGQETFSQTKDGYSDPYGTSPVDLQAKGWRDKIQSEIAGSDWKVFHSQCSTQVLDPMFMEPEAGLGWYDASAAAGPVLNLVLGTQSTNGDISDALSLLGNPACPFKIKIVQLTSCYPGGGFGGRDTSSFAPLLMLAALYSPGPVRMANDRFAQFQSGLKQLGAEIEQTIALDSQGKFQALWTVQKMLAGGKNNYSQFVAELAGYCAGGGYVFPKVAVDASAQPTPGVVAGSMRGFGGPQAAFALETLLDEVAQQLGRDPIELRAANALHEKDRTITGAPLTEPMRIAEICDRARHHPLWADRVKEKQRRSRGGRLYGVGFALANQAYGTGSDGVMAAVELAADGAITAITNCVDMGNGSATTLAISTAAALGANAGAIRMGEVLLFAALQLSSSPPADTAPSKPSGALLVAAPRHGGRREMLLRKLQQEDLGAWQNPHYTKNYALSSSSCITAFFQVHALQQASLVLFRTGVWPAASALWGLDANRPELWKQARWEAERLVFPGKPPLSRPQIAARLYADRGVAGAMAHAFFSGRWVSASYQVGTIRDHWQIDGLATRQAGAEAWDEHLRFDTVPPPPRSHYYGRSLYAPSATLAAVEVDRESGQVSVVHVHTYLDAGTVRQPDLLSGQYQGGVAMGIGYALLEDLPLGRGGAGEGDWNLDRYHVALAGDLPLRSTELELLPPLSPSAAGKGIAEAVLCPIAPAIANAVADATGRRFRSLPITPAKVREALQSRLRLSPVATLLAGCNGGPQDAGR